MELTPEAQQKYDLITRGLQEVLGGDSIKAILAEGRTPKCYFGTAPTGRPHIGYFVPLTKIADFLRAGVDVKILLADVHAFLDNLKAPFDLVGHRTKYYKKLLLAIFTSLGIPTAKLHLVEGSSYQLTREYNLDNYKLCATVSEHDAKKAGAEVVKQVSSPLISGLLYPGMQALDEQYLDVDFQFGGVDQRKIFTFAEHYLPQLGYAKRAHLMNAMLPSLVGGKMSSSDPNGKIDFLDSPEAVRKKIKNAFCEEGNVDENGLLSFVGAVIIPISHLRLERLKGQTGADAEEGEGAAGSQKPFAGEGAPEGTVFTVEGNPKFGEGSMHFQTFEEIVSAFREKKLHPGVLKTAVASAINSLLDPIRAAFQADEEWQAVEKLAYPDPNAKPEKKKKEKKYTPPPPGKGKNAKAPADAAAAAAATSPEAPAGAATSNVPEVTEPHTDAAPPGQASLDKAHDLPTKQL